MIPPGTLGTSASVTQSCLNGRGVRTRGRSHCAWRWLSAGVVLGAFVCALTFGGPDARSRVCTGLRRLCPHCGGTWPMASAPWPGFPSALQQLPPLRKILPPLRTASPNSFFCFFPALVILFRFHGNRARRYYIQDYLVGSTGLRPRDTSHLCLASHGKGGALGGGAWPPSGSWPRPRTVVSRPPGWQVIPAPEAQ